VRDIETLKWASDVAVRVGAALREGDFGDEMTSREVRDAAELVGSVLHRLAEDPTMDVDTAINVGW
jgi:hypothetical protein